MTGRKLWYLITLCMLAMLPLAGCGDSNGGGGAEATGAGTKVSVNGTVEGVAKASLFASKAALGGTVKAINITNGAELGSTSVGDDGKFTGLNFTLPSDKEIVVLVASVGTPAKTYRLLLPIDVSAKTNVLSGPVSVTVNQASTDAAKQVAAELGLSGEFGDSGMTVPAGKTWADVVAIAEKYGVLTLATTASGIKLTGVVSESSLLPAKSYAEFTADDVMNIKLGGAINSTFIPANNAPVINLTVTNAATGKGISGLPASKFTAHFAQLKADGSTWLNYKLEGPGAARDRAFLPGTTPVKSVIDKGMAATH